MDDLIKRLSAGERWDGDNAKAAALIIAEIERLDRRARRPAKP